MRHWILFVCIALCIHAAFSMPKYAQTRETSEDVLEDLLKVLKEREYRKLDTSETEDEEGEEKEEEEEEEKEVRSNVNTEKRTNEENSEGEEEEEEEEEQEKPETRGYDHTEKRTYGPSRTHSNIDLIHRVHNGGALLKSVDMETLNPDSEMFYLIDSMRIGEEEPDGNIRSHQVKGLDKLASKTQKSVGGAHDYHKLTPEQMRALNEEKNNRRRKKRNFWTTARAWEKGIIPYQIDGTLSGSSTYVKVIEDSAKLLADLTCVKWVKRTDPLAQNLGHNSFVTFFSESGCWSYVGRIGGEQKISLQAPGCVSIPTTVHEMGHAMGQMHEQSRQDRDSHINMYFDNIQGGTGNFNMKKVTTYDRNPYDQESVLQYGLKAFAIDRSKYAMSFKDTRLNFLADKETSMSFYDIQDVIDGYQCTSTCNSPPVCQNGGFVNHQCICYCPDGLTGTFCEQTVSDPVCSQGIIDLTEGQPQQITSPNYPSKYSSGKSCVWLVRAPQGKHVRLTIDNLDLPSTNNLCSHWLEVQYNLVGQTGIRHCGTYRGTTYLTSLSGDENMMMLKFDNTFASDVHDGAGFSLTVEVANAACLSSPCVSGTCNDAANGGYVCTCNPGFTGTNCDIVDPNANFVCDFDSGSCPIFKDATDDNFDWTRQTGATPSSSTGPSGAQSGSHYMYAEMSSPRVQGDVARLELTFDLSASPRCLEFYYFMYGGSVDTLRVYTSQSGSRTTVWEMKNDQGNNWIKQSIDLAGNVGARVGFEAVRGSSWNSDIAIDTISLTVGTCGNPLTTGAPTTQQPTTPSPTTPSPTTQQPTTPSPTTPSPTTQQPTTPSPTTPSPTTQQPTTPSPTTPSPTTQQPTTPSPTTPSPTTQQPTTPSPTTPSPTTQQPTTPSPTTPSPTTQQPTTPSPTTQQPTTPPPTTQPPSTTSPVTQGPTTGPALGMSCTFEPGRLCFLSDSSNDDFDWTVRSGNTPSRNTGPSSAAEGTFYSYIEASGRRSGQRAVLESTPLPASVDMCLSFQYHMKGTGLGSLDVFYGVTEFSGTNVFSDSLNHGDQWQTVSITLPSAIQAQQLFVVGTRGQSWSGDIAIDNVNVQMGACVLPTTPPLPTAGPPMTLRCSFEANEPCFLTESNSDTFDWTLRNGPTPSSNTGPQGASEGMQYKYIEASSPRRRGDFAVLESVPLADSDYCLTFDYHMFGSSGDLNVYRDNGAHSVSVFQESMTLDNQWKSTSISLPALPYSTLLFEGVRGTSYKGDVAIDNVVLALGVCTGCSSSPCKNGGTCLDAPVPAVAVAATTFSCICPPGFTGIDCSSPDFSTNTTSMACTFESDVPCFLTESTNDDFDWTRHSGPTKSKGTGPAMAFEGAFYKYIEASSPRRSGDIAVLISPWLSDEDRCFSFAYHIHGNGVGSLSVVQDDGFNSTILWQESQNFGNVWQTAIMAVPALQGSQIMISGERGRNFKGDIAIDDVLLEQGLCPCSTGFNPCQNGGVCTGISIDGVYECNCTFPFIGALCETNGFPPLFSCDFSSTSSCFMQDIANDDFDWSTGVKTPSGRTGPSVPYDGNFAYIEASSPRRRNNEATLSSVGTTLPAGDLCLSFVYNMYGNAIGKLAVLSGDDGMESEQWSLSGNQGDVWNRQTITIPDSSQQSRTILITGYRGRSFRGDIAIDNIELYPGACQ